MKKLLTLLMLVVCTTAIHAATYSVIGTINGENWDVDHDMTLDTSDGLYKYTFNDVTAGSYVFKVRVDHSWTESYGSNTDPSNSPNYTLNVATDGATIVVTFNESTHVVSATVNGNTPTPTETVYSVIGTINGNWDTDTDMTKATDGDYYYATFTNLTADTYQLKVRSNHKWSTDGSTEWGGEATADNPDGNYWVTVENDGATVTIYFDPATHAVTHSIEGGTTPEPQPSEAIYSVIGTINGDNWDVDYDMTLDATDGLYKYTFTDVANGTYKFKVRTNHAWSDFGDQEWGNGTDDYEFTVQTSNSTVTVTFDATTHVVNATVTEGGGEAAERVYSIIGDFFADTWTIDYDMTKNSDGTYTVTIPDVDAATYEYKVRVNHAWGESYPAGANINESVTVSTDGSTVTITFDPATNNITANVSEGGEEPGPGPQPGDEDTYSVIGSFFADTWTIDYDMTKNADGTYTVTISNVEAGTYECKIRTNHDWIDPSYGTTPTDDNPNGNIMITVENEGATVSITFNPNTQEVTYNVEGGTPVVNAINGIRTTNTTPVAYFNLSGQRLSSPAKGIVIVNGKKMLVK